jgi:hypothetical protein
MTKFFIDDLNDDKDIINQPGGAEANGERYKNFLPRLYCGEFLQGCRICNRDIIDAGKRFRGNYR